MIKSRLQGFFLITILLIIAFACAKISQPTGGPRDKLPPVVIKSTPLNGARNYSGKEIEITFNEYVVLENINDIFMVSPPMNKKPKVYTKGKSVIVEFEDKLKDSTTYTFYFQDAIKDLNEGNILEDYQFVFSTGPVIDSLSVTGNVYNAFNLNVPEKTQVIMFRELADTAVIKMLPDYISRVDQGGYFRINNIRAGKYRLFALKDDDNSKNYNRAEEEFAFMDSTITVTEKNFIPFVRDTTTIKKETVKKQAPAVLKGEYMLSLFLAKKRDYYLTGTSRSTKYLLTYNLSLPPGSMDFVVSIPGTASDKYLIEENRKRDTIKVWLTDSTLYSQSQISTIVKYPFTDTLGVVDYKQDTIMMRFITPRATRGTKVKVAALKVENNITGGEIKPGIPVIFKSETPFRLPDTTHIKLYELADSVKTKIPFSFETDTLNSGRLIMKAKFLQTKKYFFIADSAAFSNILNEFSDSIGIKFSVRKPESYGKLTLSISNCQGASIIQLLNSTEKLISEAKIIKDGKVIFPLLEGGLYRLKVIYDLNGDGEWTTGDYLTGRQPEPVSYYESEVEMKSNFEIDQDWNIKLRYYKNQKLLEKAKAR
jgi:hypothetical protein